MRDHLFEGDTVPPYLDTTKVLPCVDEVNNVHKMLADAHVSTIVLTGEAGIGKSTLAALLYHRFMQAKEMEQPAPRSFVWLSMNRYTTFSDMLIALLDALHVQEPDLALLTPTQQISALLRALRSVSKNALIVLDQFEQLLQPDIAGLRLSDDRERELATLFFELLHTKLGNSRMLLTCHDSRFQQTEHQGSALCSYAVSAMNVQEGIVLLQHYGIRGTAKELSMVWQRCAGHALTLVLFCAVVHIGHISPANLLLAQEYQWIWNDKISQQLIVLLYSCLSPVQRHLLRALSLFDESVPARAIFAAMNGEHISATPLPENEQFMNLFERELQTLVQLSIVQVASWLQQDARLTLHPLLRHYILEQYTASSPHQGQHASLGVSNPLNTLQESPESRRVALAAGHKQIASYYYALMREKYPPREQRTGMKDVMPLISAIRHLCLGYQWQVACDVLFAENLHTCLPRWGAGRTLIMLYTALLPPLGTLRRRDEGLVASLLATLYGQFGDYKQSQQYFDFALAAQREIRDVCGEAVTLANRGELCRMRSELQEAQHYFKQAIALHQQQALEKQQDLHLKCIVLHNMGLLYQEQKKYTVAFDCYIHALRLTYKLQEQYDKGTILTNLGLLLYEQGRYRDGLAVVLAALRLREALQDSGTTLLTRFLFGVEQKMGTEAYNQLCQEALVAQKEVFSQLMTAETMA